MRVTTLLLVLAAAGCQPVPKKAVHKGDIPMVNQECTVKSFNPLDVQCICRGPVALAWDAQGRDVIICSKVTKEAEPKEK